MTDKSFYIDEVLEADKKGFHHLSLMWNELVKLEKSRICVNFDNCKIVDANLAAALGSMLDALVDMGHEVYVTYPRSKSTRKALSRIGFLKAFNVKTLIEERENFIQYRRFSVSQSIDFKEYIQKDLIEKQRFPQCTPKAAEKIIESIYEIFANAVSHTGCKYIYCCGECHNHLGVPMLDMTLVNLGRTISENVNKYLETHGQNILSQTDSLKWAFGKGNTTKDIPGGLGLSILQEFIDINEGRIQMVSGCAVLNYSNKQFETSELDVSFPGTIVNVEFNIADKKTYSLVDEVQNLQDLF